MFRREKVSASLLQRMRNKPAEFQWKHVSFTIIIIYLLEHQTLLLPKPYVDLEVRRKTHLSLEMHLILLECNE